MNNKWFVICLILAFVGGIIVSTLGTMIFSKPAIGETVYDEKQILSQMINVFDTHPVDNLPSFTISYHPKWRLEFKPVFTVDLDYGTIEYKEKFDNLDDFMSFISDPVKYKDNVLNTSNL